MKRYARVLPATAVLNTWSGRFAYYPVSEPDDGLKRLLQYSLAQHQPKEKTNGGT